MPLAANFSFTRCDAAAKPSDFALSSSRDPGTAASTRAAASKNGSDCFWKLLKQPKVTLADCSAGGGPASWMSGPGR
jgi:hypothetical protein